MVVIHLYVMLQGSRMKLVCIGEEEIVVLLHLMNEMAVIHRYFMFQVSRMKLVCMGEEETVVGLHHLMMER